jgi:hypothetical protein
MSNILLNKPATANNFCAPFTPQKAVDGVTSAASRWVCSIKDSTNHAWLQVDLQGNYCVSQYSLAFMGSIDGWNNSQYNYNLNGYALQGSNDGGSWFNMDTVSGNTGANISKNLTPTWTRFLRVYISQGLNCNPGVSSIVEFQASEPATVPLLTSLVPSVGALNPAFNNRNFNYTINVANDVGSIAFTPTAAQTNMEIKVNNVVVQSGSQSAQINLAVGNNTIPITVKSPDGQILTTYNVYVTRAGEASYLSSLSIKDDSDDTVSYSPALSNSVLNYTASISKFVSSVVVTPMAADASATVKVNGAVVPRNQSSAPITMNTGANTITILVNSTTYTIVITKQA